MNVNKDYEKIAVVLCEKRKAMSVLRNIPPENLEQVIQMLSELAAELIEKHKAEQAELNQKQEAVRKFIAEQNLSQEEAQRIFGAVLGIDTPAGKKGRAYHSVKYRMSNPHGGKDITWTGVGRRPAAFNGLTEEELKKYEVRQ